mmetsp:Transcript_6050/g.10458  ORF Transcript_6050/g.10458 Transcript_6050/m.10458 type:complete len:680 (+) Transcript_6050:54-2093(+)
MADTTPSRPEEKGLARLSVTLRHLTDVRPVATSDDSSGAIAQAVDMEGAKFGAINALRTGNPAKDMVTAMVVPLVFKAVFDGAGMLPKIIDKISDYFKPDPPMTYERSLKVMQLRNQWGFSIQDETSRNTVLMKAITLFVAEKDLRHRQADIDLVPLKENTYSYYCDSDSDSDDEDKDSKSEAGQLKKNYRLVRNAPEEQWVQVEPGILYMKTVLKEDEGDEKSRTQKRTINITLSADTEEAVDGFIDRAYAWYLDELRKMVDNSRYMYEMMKGGSSSEDGGEKGSKTYRRYKLSDEKTFASLFFAEKEALLKLLDDFQTRSGKYSIPGYPHKLGLLLHGPPGTGKTSMIKALAQHTQRNIVNVPLARIETNAELMEVLFDNRYQVVGQEMPKKLRFKDVIFVMEDVDAISKIVHRRDGKDGTDGGIDTQSGLVVDKGSTESKKDGVKEEPSKTSDAKVEKKDEAEAKKEDAPAGADDGDKDKKSETAAELLGALLGPTGPKDSKSSGVASGSSGGDRLNLSGILNALDGVVDSPGRILVMTTNHPEKLDSALIRPGRIDKKFLLSYMAGAQSVMMVEHYFQMQLSQDERERIIGIIDGKSGQKALEITPARLEQLCAEHEEIESLCAALEELTGALHPKKLQEEKKRIFFKRQNSVNAEAAIDSSTTKTALQRTTTVP